MTAEEFRSLGHPLIDALSDFLRELPERKVSIREPPANVRAVLDATASLPCDGTPADGLLTETLALLTQDQTFNGHPRFWGYITASPAPISMLADLIVSALNPNLALWHLSPIATEIERQTVRWIAELIGYAPVGRRPDGVLSSGGQMANYIGVLAARCARASWDVRFQGMTAGDGTRVRIYASTETHAWLRAAADLFGFGSRAVRWIPTTSTYAMDTEALRTAIHDDHARGDVPLLVVGTAGSVSTGAVDPLPELAAICREHGLWFHVDAAYGGFAAALPDAPAALRALSEADSVAVDPHKWLYAPLDVGCTLVSDPAVLHATFSAQPTYYQGDEDAAVNLFEMGPENSRRFRALKVWLALRQVGRDGYEQMIADDIALARELFVRVDAHDDLEAWTQNLSITTFRYVPRELKEETETHGEYLNTLNRLVLRRLQERGEAFVSHALVKGSFLLRACVVNFHTTLDDIAILPDVVASVGAEVDREICRASRMEDYPLDRVCLGRPRHRRMPRAHVHRRWRPRIPTREGS
jgi:glutamate/tyrosine decarboxylase-like PLP-dependent enzyme